MLVIVSDNTSNQVNGVVTTYKEMAAVATEPIEIIYADQFKSFSLPFYKDIHFAFPWKLSTRLQKATKIHIATEGPLGLATVLWCRKNGKKYTSAYHTKFPEALVKWHVPISLSQSYLRWFHSGAYATFVTSESMQNELTWLNANTVVWARGVNDKVFSTKGTREPNGALLYVGRVSEEKNIEAFLDLPGYKIVVGDGPARKDLEKKYENVEWKGWLFGEELAREYRNADVLVFSSRWDTFGLVMLESIACGTPVAAYDVTGPRDVLIPGVTGVMHEDLRIAVSEAKKLPRPEISYTWGNCWRIFSDTVRIY